MSHQLVNSFFDYTLVYIKYKNYWVSERNEPLEFRNGKISNTYAKITVAHLL